jgi:hypothetical protein
VQMPRAGVGARHKDQLRRLKIVEVFVLSDGVEKKVPVL